MEGLG
jgi:hypothetical protein